MLNRLGESKQKFWNKRRSRALVLGGIFFVALLFYFFHSYRSMDQNNRIYANMGKSKLPVLHVFSSGKEINPLYGYLQEMDDAFVRDSLTLLPENRRCELILEEGKSAPKSVHYDIRSLDGAELLEKDQEGTLQEEGGRVHIILPIQNLMKEGKEYLLRLQLDLGESSVYYYTRVLLGKEDMGQEVLSLAEDFTRKSFSKSEAKSLSTYLESDDTMDNSSLAHVNLHSSFQQITWGDSGMEMDGEPEIRLKELDGTMALVQIQYASRATDQDGNVHRFFNEDNYVMRYDPQRIFLMDFDRRTKELFDGQNYRYKDKKILLGVGEKSDIEALQSATKNFYAFTDKNTLYRADGEGKGNMNRIFSYSEGEKSVEKESFTHGIHILSVDTNGDVDFLVYGYIRRGRHEGYTGIVFYTYDNSENTVVENFFLPLKASKEKLEENIQNLSYYADNRMFYIFFAGSIYGVDTNSFEVITLSTGLSENDFASSSSKQFIAYGEKNNDGELHREIAFRNLHGDKNLSISEDGKRLKVIGFLGEDFLYGLQDSDKDQIWNPQGEVPVSEIRIVGEDMKTKLSYKKDGLYFANFSLEGNQLRFDEYQLQDGEYQYVGKDSLLSNKEIKDERKLALESKVLGNIGKLQYLPMVGKAVSQFSLHYPEKFSIEKAGSIELPGDTKEENILFSAYSLGHYQGEFSTMEAAYKKIYDQFGYVVDQKERIVWNRTDRPNTATLKIQEEEISNFVSQIPELRRAMDYDNGVLLNLYGMDLHAALYYVGKGYPLMIRMEDQWELISGYNNSFITVYTLGGSSIPRNISREEAIARYEKVHNAFYGYLKK